jgi:HipA-like protein
MSATELCLLLGDDVAGTVTRLAGGKLSFAYDRTYVAKTGAATPVSVSMPTQISSHADSRITPWLWGAPSGQRRRAEPLVAGLPCVRQFTIFPARDSLG